MSVKLVIVSLVDEPALGAGVGGHTDVGAKVGAVHALVVEVGVATGGAGVLAHVDHLVRGALHVKLK